ncbi:uncharacterized protein PV09_07586 [Verruconis gallopava]|uniref:Uncharacterized protein n=1 Tax=Verruconis gallopava TaxID=253628 RepID=A0A0D2A359_9PEZI|nr:uncharacterized protein PV09_07586 [Verruconis gallopava]KIW00825.1 hypothetical protein PV09_07586 [Verruconis gallopava]
MSFTYISDNNNSKTRRDSSHSIVHRHHHGEEGKEPRAFKTALVSALLAGFAVHKKTKGDKLSSVAAAAVGALVARETKRYPWASSEGGILRYPKSLQPCELAVAMSVVLPFNIAPAVDNPGKKRMTASCISTRGKRKPLPNSWRTKMPLDALFG